MSGEANSHYHQTQSNICDGIQPGPGPLPRNPQIHEKVSGGRKHIQPQLWQSPYATSTASMIRDDTPWPNTMPDSTNLFVARESWPIPPYMEEVLTPTYVKTEKTEEVTPPKQASIPHAPILNKSQNSKPAEKACCWGPQCLICTQSNPNLKTEDKEEDWNSDRQK